jgi:hypothetical protein
MKSNNFEATDVISSNEIVIKITVLGQKNNPDIESGSVNFFKKDIFADGELIYSETIPTTNVTDKYGLVKNFVAEYCRKPLTKVYERTVDTERRKDINEATRSLMNFSDFEKAIGLKV